MWLRLDGCQCDLSFYESSRGEWIAHIYALKTDRDMRGKGRAKRLVRAIRKWAERRGVEVSLGVGPFDDQPMSREELAMFYQRMGFKFYVPGNIVQMKLERKSNVKVR